MAHLSDGSELVPSIGSPLVSEKPFDEGNARGEEVPEEEGDLPQCKIKRNYSCTMCPFFSQNPRSFLYHLRDVHFDKIKIHECSQCLYASKHSQKLQRHISMIHAPGKARGRKKNKEIKTEKRMELRPIKPKPPDSETGCAVKAAAQETIQEIAETDNSVEPLRTPEGEYLCSVCFFKHKNQKVVRKHERIVHLKKKLLKCGKCSYATPVTARYTKHVKYHSMPMIKCDLCDFRTPYKWNLDRHYKNHNGKGDFQCSKCNFRADIKQSLTVHETNHHVPPVGQGTLRRRTRAPPANAKAMEDIEEVEEELSGEKEESDVEPVEQEEKNEGETPDDVQSVRNVKVPHVNKREASVNHLQTDFIHPDDIVPRYGQIYVKNLKCRFCSYKAVFNHEIARHEKRIHGYVRPENKKENSLKRPPPNLIPIQSKNGSSAILKIPNVKKKSRVKSPEPISIDKPVNEIEFNEMCRKSSLTSSLKDFVSLIGDEEGLKSIPDSYRDLEDLELLSIENNNTKKDDLVKKEQTDFLKKKNASFFDKLKEKLLTGNNEEQSLVCDVCGHESKCLSESVAHQKRHLSSNKSESDNSNDLIQTGELSSTRCQHCRQRCKTSIDLINHLKTCKAYEAAQGNVETKVEETPEEGKSMVNRIFVWNNINQENGSERNAALTTFPGYGTVTSKGSDNTESGTVSMTADPGLNYVVKKAFKCPNCPFWASTASRFHVHIVGHLNKKPFECSLCLYRSNWRWDITKHIRLKAARDPDHLKAKVNMTDDTGRRNYSKYNKFLTIIKVQEPSAESSGYGKRTRPPDHYHFSKTVVPLPPPPPKLRKVQNKHILPKPSPDKTVHSSKPSLSPSQSASDSVKKTYWKCKKCNFRDCHKGRVLVHVRKHYMYKKNEKSLPSTGINSVDPNNSDPSSIQKMFSFSCGHCNMVSKWKHVVQRHCMLKHEGVILIGLKINKKPPEEAKKISSTKKPEEVRKVSYVKKPDENKRERPDERKKERLDESKKERSDERKKDRVDEGKKDRPDEGKKDRPDEGKKDRPDEGKKDRPDEGKKDRPDERKKEKPVDVTNTNEDYIEAGLQPLNLYSCDICPFAARTEGDLSAHKLNHVDRPGFIFKCSICPFYVPSKTAVFEHMAIHLDCDPVDYSTIKVDNFEASDRNEDYLRRTMKKGTKRYKCRLCPYLSNSRTQILYHKQNHKPRKGFYQCNTCSYNVNYRNLLNQHIKVHYFSKETKESADVKKQPSTETDFIEVLYERQSVIRKAGKRVNMTPEKVVRHDSLSSRSGLEDSISNSCESWDTASALPASTTQESENITTEMEMEEPIRENMEIVTLSSESEKQDNDKEQEVELLEVESDKNPGKAEIITIEEAPKILNFCNKCPARFIYEKELSVHLKFHMINLPFKCPYCTFSARQKPHLLSHYSVHSSEYQKQSAELIKEYPVSPINSRPKTVVLEEGESKIIDGLVWVVPLNVKTLTKSKKEKYSCPHCPQKYNHYPAIKKHLTCHGKKLRYKCYFCNYSVNACSTFLRHQAIHKEHMQNKNSLNSPSTSDKDLNEKITENNAKSKTQNEKLGQRKSWKNRKNTQKPFKCNQCPSSFERHRKYVIHRSLHGAKQKYKCAQCDYSVNYRSNYLYHIRSHRIHDAKVQKKGGKLNRLFFESLDNYRKTFRCKFCGYASRKQYQLKLHFNRHFRVSGVRMKLACNICDYSTDRTKMLDSHSKLHFTPRFKPEKVMKFEKVELWCQESEQKPKTLIFQDKGKDTDNRFYPHVDSYNIDEEHNTKVFIDLKSGKSVREEKMTLDSPVPQEMVEKKDPEEKVIQEELKRWNCEKCPQVFSHEEHYMRHCELHGAKKNYNCDICDYSVKFYSNYVRHIKMHQKKEPDRNINVRDCDGAVKKKCGSLDFDVFDEKNESDSQSNSL